jgi:predicted HTH domain antitoxin
MIDWRLALGLVGGLLLTAIYALHETNQKLKLDIEVAEKQIILLESTVQLLNVKVDNERKAVLERAERLNEAEKGNEELAKKLAESCALRPDWAVPDALYERLCR